MEVTAEELVAFRPAVVGEARAVLDEAALAAAPHACGQGVTVSLLGNLSTVLAATVQRPLGSAPRSGVVSLRGDPRGGISQYRLNSPSAFFRSACAV